MKSTVLRHLVVNLTEEEITRCSQELARVTTQQAELEEEKKTVVSSYKEKLDRCVSDSRSLARKISTKQDMREVECEWFKDYDLRIGRLMRLDTCEEVERRKLTADELQEELKFNQEPEETEEVAPRIFNDITVCKNTACMNYSSVDTNGCSTFEHVYECENATAEAPEVINTPAEKTSAPVADEKDGITPEKIETLQVELSDKSLKNYRMQIYVAQGDTGAWYNAFHLHTPNGGKSYAPYPKFSEQYPARKEAITAACELAYNSALDLVKDDKITRQIAAALADFNLAEAGK